MIQFLILSNTILLTALHRTNNLGTYVDSINNVIETMYVPIFKINKKKINTLFLFQINIKVLI